MTKSTDNLLNGQVNGQPIICIFGSYAAKKGQPLYEQAYAIGHSLARAGYTICNGGYDGTMRASAKGAKDAGGTTIGVTCTIFSGSRNKPLKANRYIDHEIPHDDLYARIDAMMRMSAGYVVLEGGTGTLTELAIVWESVCKKLIDPRPIIVVGDFWRPLVDQLTRARPKTSNHLHIAETTTEVLDILIKAL